jgi:hypothetical protein
MTFLCFPIREQRQADSANAGILLNKNKNCYYFYINYLRPGVLRCRRWGVEAGQPLLQIAPGFVWEAGQGFTRRKNPILFLCAPDSAIHELCRNHQNQHRADQ